MLTGPTWHMLLTHSRTHFLCRGIFLLCIAHLLRAVWKLREPPAWFILVFRTYSCLLPCLKVENKKDISGLRSMWGCRVWGRNRARWAIKSTILKWVVATILHASSTYSFRYPLVHNPSLFSFSKICSSFFFSLSIREQIISLSENLLSSHFFSLYPSHTKHFPFLPNFTSFSFCIITTD